MVLEVPFLTEGILFGWPMLEKKLHNATLPYPNEPVLYRIRVPASGTANLDEGQRIRYLTAPKLPADTDKIPPGRSLLLTSNTALAGLGEIPQSRPFLLAFDIVPAGNWNLGRLMLSSAGDNLVLSSTELSDLEKTIELGDGGPAWCGRTVELTDLLDVMKSGDNQNGPGRRPKDIQCMNWLHAEIIPTPSSLSSITSGSNVVAIWSWEPSDIHGIADATHNYSIINARDPGLAPKFLAHITDNGTRVVGYVTERIVGAREAGPEDLEKCRATLSRFHALRLVHDSGPPWRHMFLVRSDGTMLLQHFGGCRETTDTEDMEHNLEDLEDILSRSPSQFERHNGPVDLKYNAIIEEFKKRDGFVHPIVGYLLSAGGYKTVTAEQHTELIAKLAAKDYIWTWKDMVKWRKRFRVLAGAGATGKPSG